MYFILKPSPISTNFREYIATDNLSAADRVREDIYETIKNLTAFPLRGHGRPDLAPKYVRFVKPRVLAAILRDRK